MGALLAYIGQLYAVEKRGRKAGLHGEDLRRLRQEVSRAIAASFTPTCCPSTRSYFLKVKRAKRLPIC